MTLVVGALSSVVVRGEAGSCATVVVVDPEPEPLELPEPEVVPLPDVDPPVVPLPEVIVLPVNAATILSALGLPSPVTVSYPCVALPDRPYPPQRKRYPEPPPEVTSLKAD